MLIQQMLSYYICHVRDERARRATVIELFKGYFQSALSFSFKFFKPVFSLFYTTLSLRDICMHFIIITKNQT